MTIMNGISAQKAKSLYEEDPAAYGKQIIDPPSRNSSITVSGRTSMHLHTG